MNDQPILIEQIFKQPIEVVWKAITEKNQMIQWFFNSIPDFKAEVGYKTQFLIENDGRKFTHLWEIIEVIPKRKIVYDWRYKEYEGKGKVYFELFEENDQTLLRLTSTGIETFTADIPEFKREAGVNGWNYFIRQSLKTYLEALI